MAAAYLCIAISSCCTAEAWDAMPTTAPVSVPASVTAATAFLMIEMVSSPGLIFGMTGERGTARPALCVHASASRTALPRAPVAERDRRDGEIAPRPTATVGRGKGCSVAH